MSALGAAVDPAAAAAWRRTLTAVVAGREGGEELVRRSGFPGAEELIADALAVGLERQDWDVVEALLPVCVAAPDCRYAAPLAAILDRECLEISNLLLLEALAAIDGPEALPAIRGAHARTCVPRPDWAPDAAGSERAEEMRDRCAAILARRTEGETVNVLPQHQAIDWDDFEAAGKETREILRRLDEDRAALRGLVEAADRRAVAVDVDGNEVAIALHEAPGDGVRLRLHVFRDARTGEPHAYSRSRSIRVLAGRYRLTWYEELGDNGSGAYLAPYLTRVELPGNTYTLHHGTVHSIDPAADTVALVLSESPDEDPAGEGTAELHEEAVAVLERLGVI